MIRRAPPDVVFVVRGASYASAEEASIESWAVRGRAVRENQARLGATCGREGGHGASRGRNLSISRAAGLVFAARRRAIRLIN